MINLRRSRLDDHWRRTYRREYPISPKTILCNNGEIFNGLRLDLKQGINAIVGKNGTGKSNFIRALFNALSSENSNRKKFIHLLDNSEFCIEIAINGVSSTLNFNPNDANANCNDFLGLLFDPCNLIPDIQKMFYEQDNIEELLESYSAVTINKDDLKLVNFLTNSTYSKIEIFNIEDEYDAFPMLPFFAVEQLGSCYDSRRMGLGELSLFYFFWLIDRIKKSDLPCFLIIEEPESFLPPLIQDRFCDVLALNSATEGTAILISTHSEHILKKIPRSHIHIMRRGNGNVRFLSASSNFEQLSLLGLTSPKKGMLIFEDHAANLFLKSIIRASQLFVTDSFFYHRSGSDGDIIKDLDRFPADLKSFSIIGVFDGDCRDKLDVQLRHHNNYLFLPTRKSPEELLIEYLITNSPAVSMHLRTTIELLSASIDVAEGTDPHDYFYVLAQTLDLEYDFLFSQLCDLWIADPTNQTAVNSFFSELEDVLK